MIDTIISSSVLIVIILAIRAIFKGKINPVFQYGLWGLVVLRLVAFSWLDLYPIQSRLSVMNLTGKASETIRQAASVEQVLQGQAPPSAIDQGVIMMDNLGSGIVTKGDGIVAAAAIDWQLVLFVVWLLGAVLLSGIFIYTNRRFVKSLTEKRQLLMVVSAELDGEQPLKLQERGQKEKLLPVYVVADLASPCLMNCKGETAIYMTPETAADENMRHYAILHELCHFKHHDLMWSVVRGGLLVLYWMNPLVWVAAIMSKRDCELACDYAVLKRIGEESRLAYGTSLLDLISSKKHKGTIFCTATTMVGGARGIRERITMIVKKNKWRKSTLVAVLLVAALAVGCTFTVSEEEAEGYGGKEDLNMAEFAADWAEAYSDRNAQKIYDLTADEEVYLNIGHKEEDGTLWMGLSSPWPWGKDYVIEVVDDHRADIYYYFRTSDPMIYVGKETIVLGEAGGEYKVVEENMVHYDQIQSKVDFDAAYKPGFPDFSGIIAEAYQRQADADNQGSVKEIFENPVKAAMHQLNIPGANMQNSLMIQPSKVYEDPHIKSAVIVFPFPDGSVTVPLIQPVIKDEKGVEKQGTVWVVVDENELSSRLPEKEDAPKLEEGN